MSAVRVDEWLRAAARRIDRLDARLLLEEVAGLSHAAIVARPETLIDAAQTARLEALVTRRASGEPLAYLLGWVEFRGLRLTVSPAVLVPRPETELLVERVLACVDALAAGMSRPMPDAGPVVASAPSPSPAPSLSPMSVLDLGTGSGAIPLAIKAARPAWDVLGADLSPAALGVAQANAARLGLGVRFFESDWYGKLPAGLAVDCVVSNPPYVAAGDPHLAGDGLRFEPQMALTDFSDGLSCFRRIVGGAGAVLKPGGVLLVEHGYDQAAAVRALLAAAGFEHVQSWQDLAGIERISGGYQTRGA